MRDRYRLPEEDVDKLREELIRNGELSIDDPALF